MKCGMSILEDEKSAFCTFFLSNIYQLVKFNKI